MCVPDQHWGVERQELRKVQDPCQATSELDLQEAVSADTVHHLQGRPASGFGHTLRGPDSNARREWSPGPQPCQPPIVSSPPGSRITEGSCQKHCKLGSVLDLVSAMRHEPCQLLVRLKGPGAVQQGGP